MKLKNRVAVITGAAQGIGEAICVEMAKEGAIVAAVDVNEDGATRTAGKIGDLNGIARSWKVDVGSYKAVEEAANAIEEALGPIDIWVNNAGISQITPFLDCTEEEWEKTIRVNLTGTFHGCKAAIRRMITRKKGAIINLSSQSGRIGSSQYAAYCASKFGVVGLTQSIAMEFARSGIRANALCPGVVWTPLWENMASSYARKYDLEPTEVASFLEKRIPLGRLCSPIDCARTAVFLASDDASYITGQSIILSGGAVVA